MMHETFIPVISRHAPEISVSDALEMALNLERVSELQQNRDTEFQQIARAAIWADKTFGITDRNYKIRCIKEVRNHFRVSLLAAKTIVENVTWSGPGLGQKGKEF